MLNRVIGSDLLIIGCGTWGLGGACSIGGKEAGIPESGDPVGFLQHAIDRGINLFETSACYGLAEERLGEALAGVARERFFVASKGGIREDGSRDYSAGHLNLSLAASLARLQTSWLDLYQVALDRTLTGDALCRLAEQLQNMKESGRVRFVGLSIATEQQGYEAIATGQIDVLQVTLNLLDMRMLPLIRAAAVKGVAVLIKSPLNKGVLSASELVGLPEGDSRRVYLTDGVVALRREAARRIVTEAGLENVHEAAVRLPLSIPGVTSVLFSMRRREHLEPLLRYEGMKRYDASMVQALYESSTRNIGLIAQTL